MAAATVLRSGSKAVTTAGTPVVLSSTSQQASWVTIQSKQANTGLIYVGASASIAGGGSGYTLVNPSDSVVFWDSSTPVDLSLVFIDASVSGEGVDFLAIVP